MGFEPTACAIGRRRPVRLGLGGRNTVGSPGGTRTPDTRGRSPLLYSTELRSCRRPWEPPVGLEPTPTRFVIWSPIQLGLGGTSICQCVAYLEPPGGVEPTPLPYQGSALPLELRRHGASPRSRTGPARLGASKKQPVDRLSRFQPHGLQLAADIDQPVFSRRLQGGDCTRATGEWSRWRDSNPQPPRYECGAQPLELHRQSLELERIDGIEPTSPGWKPDALPLCYTRNEIPKSERTAGDDPATPCMARRRSTNVSYARTVRLSTLLLSCPGRSGRI